MTAFSQPPFQSHSAQIHTYITKTAQTGGFCYVAERVGFLFCGKARLVAACHRHPAKSRLSNPTLQISMPKNKNTPAMGCVLIFGGESGIPFLRKSHGGCGVPPAPRQEPPFESHSTNIHTYITKTAQTGGFCYVAERVGFEPTDARASPVFKTGAFNHSTISPNGRGLLYHRPRRRSILYQSTCSLPESSFTSTRQTSTWGYWAI